MKNIRLKLVFLLLSLFGLFLFFFFFSNDARKPRPLPVEDVPPLEQTRFKNIPSSTFFLETFPELPRELPVYVVSFNQNLLGVSQEIASQLGFPSAPTDVYNEGASWEKDSFYLSYDSFLFSLSFSNAFFLPESRGFPFAESDVVSLLTKIAPLPEGVTLKESSRYDFFGSGGLADNRPQKRLEYFYYLNSFPVFFDALNQSGLQIVLDSSSVVSFSYVFTPDSLTEQELSPLLSVSDIPVALAEGKGYLSKLADTRPSSVYEVSPEFTRVAISSVTIAYLYIKENSLLVPVYVVSGTGTNGRTTQSVEFILRATN